MSAYYNEFDPFAAEWLRELIKDGLIADGVVDERSIEDVDPSDIREFTQCHFFAGIGGWSYAARLAKWPDNRPMWSGSPPCQPFSSAGNRKGKDDLRHLWPVFFNLIRECQPAVVFGEQVASAIRMGWFDDLQADMENEGYATGMVVLPANFVGAPHKRERLFYVAERLANSAMHGDCRGLRQVSGKDAEQQTREEQGQDKAEQFVNGREPSACGANATSNGWEAGADQGWSERERGSSEQGRSEVREVTGNSSRSGSSMGDTKCERLEGHTWSDNGQRGGSQEIRSGSETGFWDNCGLAYCRDNKYRPISTEPALFPLANGIPNRVGLLRGAGNAIVPQVGAEVIRAFMEK